MATSIGFYSCDHCWSQDIYPEKDDWATMSPIHVTFCGSYLTRVESCKLPVCFMVNQETTLTLRCQGFRYLSSCRAGWTPFLLTGTMQGCLKDLFIVWIVLYNFQHSALQLNNYSFVWHWCTSRVTHPLIQNSEGDLHMTYMWLCTVSENSASCGPRMELIRLFLECLVERWWSVVSW